MEDEYKMEDSAMADTGSIEGVEIDLKEFGDIAGYDEYEEDDGGGFRNNRGRGNFRNGRGRPPHSWMNGPPRFRGRGYGPQGPPMRGRGFFRGRGAPRFANSNFDGNWGPMGPPPPGMMGGPPPFGPPPGMMPGGPMGPPPNLMQPPPFGGPPPGTGIPNMPNPELWVETKAEDGKSYFYHARTRETTWTRPQEGPGINCRVISQADVEAMAANNAMMQGGPPQQMPMGMGGPMPNGAPMMGAPGQPSFMSQPPTWMKEAQNPQSQDENNPPDNDEMPPGETAPLQQQSMGQPQHNGNQMPFPGMPGGPNFSQAPPNYNQGPGGAPFGAAGGPPGSYPPGWGGWGGWPPPLVAQPPPNLSAAAVPDGGAVQQPQQNQLGMNPPGVNNQMPGTLPGVPGSMTPLPGQMPGQMQGQMPGQMQGQMPGQMQGQMSGQMQGQMPGQMQGQMPGQMQGQMPGQMQGQMPGQMQGQMPGQMQGQMPGQMQGQMSGQMQGQMPGQMQGQMPGVPGQMPGGPGQMPGVPGQMPGGPGQIPGGPGQMPGGPGQMLGGPGQMHSGQGQMSGGPGQMLGGPGQMHGGPGQMSGGPGQMHGGPGQMSGGPGQMPAGTSALPGQGNILPEIIALAGTPPPSTATKKEETKIPPELIAAAAAWSSHRSPDGRPYYYHAANQESVWEKPKPLKELEDFKQKMNAERLKDKRRFEIDDNDQIIEVVDVEAHAEAVAAAEAEAVAAVLEAEKKSAAEKEKAEKERLEKEKAEKERLEKEKVEKEKEAAKKKKADKRRPVVSTPISGTPWCVVWTGDGRVFFYNPTAPTSSWERPAVLAGRADVDALVSQPPQALLDLQKKEAGENKGKTSNGETKRAVSDSEESDAEPRKKPKPEEKKQSNQIDLGKEAAIEAEVRAARERGVVPHEQRLRSFQQMLNEKQVSAFSTWEKELHKIVFDPRYLMLNSKERRQVFDQYVRDRAEEERKEKKNQLQQKKLVFRALLDEAKLHSKSSFNEFSSKYSRDERFKSIEKSRGREVYFSEYIAELRKKEKDDKEKKREQVKVEYLALLKEKGIDRHTRFLDAKKKIDSDPRYKAVEGGAAREDYFREYCKQLKDDRRKDKDTKERDRTVKKEKKEKDRDKEKEGKEVKEKKKKEKGEPKKEEPAATEQMETEEADDSTDSVAKEKQARAQASIKEREREVQRALATSLRDRDKEREQHKRDEAVQHFNALLADLVRNPELAWREAKKQLKKDHRYNLAELLTKDDKERLFTQHTSSLASKRRDKLRAILTDLGVGCTSHWKEVREMLKNEPTTPAYSSSSQMEREFRDFVRDKQSSAKTQLRQLLQETRSITHRSLSAVRSQGAGITAIHDALKHDARYLALEHIPDERQSIITTYLEELDKKGPPPPPTATEPSRRPKP